MSKTSPKQRLETLKIWIENLKKMGAIKPRKVISK